MYFLFTSVSWKSRNTINPPAGQLTHTNTKDNMGVITNTEPDARSHACHRPRPCPNAVGTPLHCFPSTKQLLHCYHFTMKRQTLASLASFSCVPNYVMRAVYREPTRVCQSKMRSDEKSPGGFRNWPCCHHGVP